MQAPRDAAVFVFERVAGQWQQTARFTLDSAQIDDHFAAQVDVSGDTIAVGAPGADLGIVPGIGVNTGVVHVFVRDGVGWTQQQRLSGVDTGTYDEFGSTLSLQGNRLAVGAPGADNGVNDAFHDAGAVYVFERTGATWSQTAKLTSGDDARRNSLLGRHVALDGDRITSGARRLGVGNVETSSAYVFEHDGLAWTRSARIDAPAQVAGFAHYELALHGDRLLVGVDATIPPLGPPEPAAWLFEADGGAWSSGRRLLPFDLDDPRAGGSFGIAGLALGDGTAMVGAILDDLRPDTDAQTFQGAVYLLFDGDAIFCDGFEAVPAGCPHRPRR